MAEYATLVRDQVILTRRWVDRILLKAYVPKLQSVGGWCAGFASAEGVGNPVVGGVRQDRRLGRRRAVQKPTIPPLSSERHWPAPPALRFPHHEESQ
jgi:hypothetical protein